MFVAIIISHYSFDFDTKILSENQSTDKKPFKAWFKSVIYWICSQRDSKTTIVTQGQHYITLMPYLSLVYATQVNSAFGARWLASPEVIIQVLFTSEQPKRNKLASRFASIFEKEILSMNGEPVPKNTNMATKFGVTVFNDKLFNLSSLIF